jgi:LPXTG-motif cell wall-anchored protein
VKLVQKQELITSLLTLAGSPTILIPLAILIIAIILFFIFKRRKKDKKGKRRF